MLLGIDPRMPSRLLDCLMRMGHGDEIVIADANFPAASTAASAPIEMTGFDAVEVTAMICALMPLDECSEAAAYRMEIDNAPDEMGEVHEAVAAALPDEATLGSIERRAFYPRAGKAFAVVQCGDARPYGCFILRKGVIYRGGALLK